MSKKSAAALTLSSCPLQSFLESCRVAKGDTYNFTSIAKPFGSYYVPDARMREFYQLYCDTIEKHSVMPFLTEKPGPFSPILVDLDFKYDLAIADRQYTDTFVKQFVQEYFNYIGQYIELDRENGQCYVFERSKPYQTARTSKDGIHMMFPFIHCPTSLKLLARDHLITEQAAMFQELGTTNSISDIVDRAVIDQNNWFCFGSGKPGCEPYALTHVIDFEGNEVDKKMPFRELVPMLSVKGKTLPDVRYKENMEDVLAARFEQLSDAKFRQQIKEVQKQRSQANIRIRSKFEQCTNLPFVRKLVTLLSKSRADDYQDWMQVGWCLHNIDDRLEIINEDGQKEPSLLESWIGFSKRSEKYEEGCCDKRWGQMRQGALGMGSLVRWAKNDNSDEFDLARGEDIRELIDKSAMSGGAHHSVAKVLYAMYRYQFICVSRKFRTWIEFRNHRWVRIEEAYSLQTKLSNELYGEYSKVQIELANRITQTPDLAEKEMYEKKKTIFSKIGTNLLQTTYKKNVMIEAAELFYCEGLEEKLDTNRNLLAFENGVYDLTASEFRDGRPEDYITLSTGIEYVPYDPEDASVKTVYKIFNQIHVDPAIREYIFMLLASFLSGDNKSQKFHIWTGESGSNGKSLSVDMFMHALGNYASIMPVSLLTSKRSASNAATPELARTKGRRFCVLQEPEGDVKVNCGLLKELSGGDSIVTRELYGPIMQFTPQFKMVLTCNRLPEIPSQDGGTWRRIRVVEFQSRFCDEPDPNNPREFKIDNTFSTRMDELSTALLSICVHYYQKYKELGCKVQEPDCVMQFTKQYQQRSDNLLDFINLHIVNTGVRSDVLRVGEIYVLFKDWYRANIGDGARIPNCKDLKEYLESKFGKSSHSSWRGYAIKVGSEDEDPEE